MVAYREIIRQRALGISVRNIAFSCKCSTATVRAVLERAQTQGLTWPLPQDLSDKDIREILNPKKPAETAHKAQIDHDYVARELLRPAVTMQTLWSEYYADAYAQGLEPYMYSAFCQRHRAWAEETRVRMHIELRPAHEMQVDYVGTQMHVVDTQSGEALKVYIFVACLPGMP